MTDPAPWKTPRPKQGGKTKLTAANVAWAKARAKKAGRRYPNLVDNMAAARRQQPPPDHAGKDHP